MIHWLEGAQYAIEPLGCPACQHVLWMCIQYCRGPCDRQKSVSVRGHCWPTEIWENEPELAAATKPLLQILLIKYLEDTPNFFCVHHWKLLLPLLQATKISHMLPLLPCPVSISTPTFLYLPVLKCPTTIVGLLPSQSKNKAIFILCPDKFYMWGASAWSPVKQL